MDIVASKVMMIKRGEHDGQTLIILNDGTRIAVEEKAEVISTRLREALLVRKR